MSKFHDSKGQEWEIRFTVGDLERVKEEADFDIDKLVENPDTVAAAALQWPKKTAQILWVLCEDEAKTRNIDPRSFGRLLDRDTLDRATDALVEAILLFYPRSSAGRAIKGRLPEMLRRMDMEIETTVGQQLDKAFSGTATGSPASSASIPPG